VAELVVVVGVEVVVEDELEVVVVVGWYRMRIVAGTVDTFVVLVVGTVGSCTCWMCSSCTFF
jgi:hypothetical protein